MGARYVRAVLGQPMVVQVHILPLFEPAVRAHRADLVMIQGGMELLAGTKGTVRYGCLTGSGPRRRLSRRPCVPASYRSAPLCTASTARHLGVLARASKNAGSGEIIPLLRLRVSYKTMEDSELERSVPGLQDDLQAYEGRSRPWPPCRSPIMECIGRWYER